MKRVYLYFGAIALIGFITGLVVGIRVGAKRGIPFVARKQGWTIGIVHGETPFDFDPARSRHNPVLTSEDVTDAAAKFVADPFLMRKDATWYLFFEVYNLATQQGDLAVATSSDTRRWTYEKIILDEPFHLSYPYVFEWEGEYYLIPESSETSAVRLYRATDFPTEWTFVTTLLEGRALVDPSVIYFQERWWLFAAETSNDTLRLYHADDLRGPWQEHAQSPIVEKNSHIARPSGRIIIHDDRLYRFTTDVDPPVGTHQVWVFEIKELTPTTYREALAREEPVLQADGSGWMAYAMHQVDPHRIGPGQWIASVDGYGEYVVYGWGY